MAPKGLNAAVVCCVVTLLFIGLTLMMWYLLDPTTGLPTTSEFKKENKRDLQKREQKFIPWIISWAYNNSITFTVPPNTATTVKIPIRSLKGFKGGAQISGARWLGYWWYLTGNEQNLGWDSLITTQDGPYWPTGSSTEARFFRDKVTLKKKYGPIRGDLTPIFQ